MVNMKCAHAVISEKIMLMESELLKVIAHADVLNLGKKVNVRFIDIFLSKP